MFVQFRLGAEEEQEENKHEVNREQPSLDPPPFPVKYVQREGKSCAAESNLEKNLNSNSRALQCSNRHQVFLSPLSLCF